MIWLLPFMMQSGVEADNVARADAAVAALESICLAANDDFGSADLLAKQSGWTDDLRTGVAKEALKLLRGLPPMWQSPPPSEFRLISGFSFKSTEAPHKACAVASAELSVQDFTNAAVRRWGAPQKSEGKITWPIEDQSARYVSIVSGFGGPDYIAIAAIEPDKLVTSN